MLVQLPNGKAMDVPVHLYINMADEEFQYLLSTDEGDEIGDPFYGSALRSRQYERPDRLELPGISVNDKLMDKDFIEEG